MIFRLRDFQQHGSDRVIEEFRTVGSTLVVWPTGLGKTILFSDVIRRMQPLRAMVLAHRRELIYQAKERIEFSTGIQCQVEMGSIKADKSLFGRPQVVISTFQTQNSGARRQSFSPDEFGLLIVDEAHRSVSPTFKGVIDYYRQNPAIKVLGVTATPDRLDEEALGQVFESVADEYELLQAIKDGWLVEPWQQCYQILGLDYSHVRTTAGDLNTGDLSKVLQHEEISQRIVQASLEAMYGAPEHSLYNVPLKRWPEFLAGFGNPKRTLVFTVSVEQAKMMSDIFNRVHQGMATWVCGATPENERKQIVTDFLRGKYAAVCNCDVFGEGYDNPGIEMVIIARPTKSRAKYAQMIGRGTRPLPGTVDGLDTAQERLAAIAASPKTRLTVLDFVGNSGRHKLTTTADILSGNVSDDVLDRARKIATQSEKPVQIAKAVEQAQEDIKREIEEARKRVEARKARLVARARWTSKKISPFDVLNITPAIERGWDRGKQLSEKQRAVLRKQGVDPDSMPYTHAKQLLNEIFDRWNNQKCTYGQARVLSRYGLDINISRTQASAWLDAIAKNGWKKPDWLDIHTMEDEPF